MAILQDIQDKYKYIPEDAIRTVCKRLAMSLIDVYGVATFYTSFNLKPVGKHLITVCMGTACHVRGGARILREVEKRLGIKSGQTTDDMEYTLETIACIGACALAPTMTIDKETHGQMTTKKVTEVFSV